MTKRKQIEENRGRRIRGVALAVRTLVLLIVVAFVVLATPSLCLAQVQLPAVNLGDTNFEDAFGGPGWLLQEFPEFYVASEFKDSHGKTKGDLPYFQSSTDKEALSTCQTFYTNSREASMHKAPNINEADELKL